MTGPSVTIDAGVLVVPRGGTIAEHAHRFVESVLDWSKLLDEPWVAIYMSERATEALIKDGLFPFREELRRLFGAHGIVEYDVNTVALVADRVLRLTPSFETFFRVRDVLAEDVATAPDILQLCPGPALQSDLARCIVLIAVLRRHCCGEVQAHTLVLRDAPARTVRVRALVHDLEHEREDLEDVSTAQEYFEGEVLACDSFAGQLNCIDESVVFSSATDDVGIAIACRMAVFKARETREGTADWDDTLGFRTGRVFRQRAQNCCRSAPSGVVAKLLRAIAETIEHRNLDETHWLRVAAGGNAPQRQRQRDGAKAWRRNVDYEYHLHYWELTDGSVELASAGPHGDLSIPE